MFVIVYLILFFDFLVRCSASPYIIELAQERYHVKLRNGISPSVLLDQPLTINVYSDEDIKKIACRSKNYKTNYFEANMFKHDDRNYYTPLNVNIIATPVLNSTWVCVLAFKKLNEHFENFVFFSLQVDISDESRSDIVWYISGAVAAIVVAVIVTFAAVRVRRKTRTRRVDGNDNDEGVCDSEYESVNYVACQHQGVSNTVAAAEPLHQPPPREEENQKYIHYDTVYEGRLHHMIMMDQLRKKARK